MAEMEAHLATCELCRERLEKLRAMETCLRTALAEPVDVPDFGVPLPARPVRRRAWSWAFAASALVVLVVAGWMSRAPHAVAPKVRRYAETRQARTVPPRRSPSVVVERAHRDRVAKRPEPVRPVKRVAMGAKPVKALSRRIETQAAAAIQDDYAVVVQRLSDKESREAVYTLPPNEDANTERPPLVSPRGEAVKPSGG